MLYREINAVCSEIHTKHINILCGQSTEFLNINLLKPSGFFKYRKVQHAKILRGARFVLSVL
jgi:hypothetical protein